MLSLSKHEEPPRCIPPHFPIQTIELLCYTYDLDMTVGFLTVLEQTMSDLDQLEARIRTSAITLGTWDVAAVMVFYAAYLGIWGFLLAQTLRYPAWMAGLAVAAAQALWHYRLIRQRDREGCFTAFRQNHWLGFAVFVGIALSLPW
jgi:4-hydroxybenzoate polyprenyltransferase